MRGIVQEWTIIENCSIGGYAALEWYWGWSCTGMGRIEHRPPLGGGAAEVGEGDWL